MSAMTVGKGKRPRDPNQLAAWTVAVATGQSPAPPEAEPAPAAAAPSIPAASLSAYMSAIGRKGGLVGGKRRLKTMTREQRRRVAVAAAQARWKKPVKKSR